MFWILLAFIIGLIVGFIIGVIWTNIRMMDSIGRHFGW